MYRKKEAPFDPSMMVHFRKRLSGQVMQEINELICLEKKSDDRDPDDKNAPGGGSGKKNKGRLIIDQHAHRRIFATRPIDHCSMKPAKSWR